MEKAFMRSIAMLLWATCLIGCGESHEDGPLGSGAGGATSSSNSSAAAGGSGGVVCGSAALAPFACEHVYPDPLLAYDPAADPGFLIGPAPGEYPGGAAAGRVDAQSGTVVAVYVGFGPALPARVRVAVWQEPACGIPALAASALPYQDIDHSAVTASDDLSRLPLPAPVTLSPASGQTWLAIGFTGPDVVVGSVESAADEHESRFVWYGLVDRNCDGENDVKDGAPAIGPEDIRTPSAHGVDTANVDLAIGAELAH